MSNEDDPVELQRAHQEAHQRLAQPNPGMLSPAMIPWPGNTPSTSTTSSSSPSNRPSTSPRPSPSSIASMAETSHPPLPSAVQHAVHEAIKQVVQSAFEELFKDQGNHTGAARSSQSSSNLPATSPRLPSITSLLANSPLPSAISTPMDHAMSTCTIVNCLTLRLELEKELEAVNVDGWTWMGVGLGSALRMLLYIAAWTKEKVRNSLRRRKIRPKDGYTVHQMESVLAVEAIYRSLDRKYLPDVDTSNLFFDKVLSVIDIKTEIHTGIMRRHKEYTKAEAAKWTEPFDRLAEVVVRKMEKEEARTMLPLQLQQQPTTLPVPTTQLSRGNAQASIKPCQKCKTSHEKLRNELEALKALSTEEAIIPLEHATLMLLTAIVKVREGKTRITIREEPRLPITQKDYDKAVDTIEDLIFKTDIAEGSATGQFLQHVINNSKRFVKREDTAENPRMPDLQQAPRMQQAHEQQKRSDLLQRLQTKGLQLGELVEKELQPFYNVLRGELHNDRREAAAAAAAAAAATTRETQPNKTSSGQPVVKKPRLEEGEPKE